MDTDIDSGPSLSTSQDDDSLERLSHMFPWLVIDEGHVIAGFLNATDAREWINSCGYSRMEIEYEKDDRL